MNKNPALSCVLIRSVRILVCAVFLFAVNSRSFLTDHASLPHMDKGHLDFLVAHSNKDQMLDSALPLPVLLPFTSLQHSFLLQCTAKSDSVQPLLRGHLRARAPPTYILST